MHTYEQIDQREWQKFVKNHPQGTVFHMPEMCKVYEEAENTMPLVVAIKREKHIVGLMVAQVMWNGGKTGKWLTGRSIIMGGPLVENDEAKVLTELMAAYQKQLPKWVVYSEIRPVYSIDELMNERVSELKRWKRVGHYNLVMKLEKTEEELFEQMHKERRRNVNQAIKAGLTFKELTTADEIQQVVALIEKTYRRKHVPIGYLNMFDKVQGILKNYAHFFGCYTAEGQMIAGQVRLCYGTLVYAWFAGSDEKCFKLRPNDFTMWNVIRWAREKGYKEFDFGGGGEPGKPYGVRDYKLKYGCEMFDYGRYIWAHRPVTYWLAAKMYGLYHKIKGK